MEKQHKSILLWFDRALSQNSLRQIIILGSILVAVIIVSFLLLFLSGNDWVKYCETNHISKWLFPLYLLIDGNAFNGFYINESASRTTVFIACLIYIAGVIIFTGMMISVMTNIIERRVEDYREGHIHYLKSGHYIIMGYDDMVPSFIKYIFSKEKYKEEPDSYILIFTSAKVVDITEKLRKYFDEKQMRHIIINYGHRTTSESYKSIHLESSEEIFIVGNHSQPAHDAINVECVDCICHYLENLESNQHPSKITCVFKDLDTYAAFKTTEIFEKVRKRGIEFVPYNFYTGWAKQVFVKRSYRDTAYQKEIQYPAVYGNGITDTDPHFVHLVFVGTTNFAVAFAMEAAHFFHFPNFNHQQRLKTRITFIDLNADKEKDEFITRNRHFFEVQAYRYQDFTVEPCEVKIIEPDGNFDTKNFLDIEFEFIKGDIFSKNVQNEIAKWANDTDSQYLSVFLAMENQHSNFVMGMNMPDEVYDNEIPIFIRQDRSDNFVTNLREANKETYEYTKMVNTGELATSIPCTARYAHIYPFGMNETAYCADNKSLKRAKLINYLYKTADYNKRKFKSIESLQAIPIKELRKEADKLWLDLEVALVWSNLYNAYTIKTKLASLRAMRGLSINDHSQDTSDLNPKEVEELAKVEHNRWNVEKLLMGYRKPHRDEDKYLARNQEDEKKLDKNKKLFVHHDIRPFDELGTIKELDMEFSRYIPWMIKMTEEYDF